MRHLIDPKDLSVEETGDILALAERIRDNMPAYSEAAKGKKIATLFYEPSTRTRLSFETCRRAGSALPHSPRTFPVPRRPAAGRRRKRYRPARES